MHSQSYFAGRINDMTLVKRITDLYQPSLNNTPTRFKRDQEASEAIHGFVNHYYLKNYTANFRNDANKRNGIINFVHEIKADMLAMATHGRKGIAHLFTGSLTEVVVNHMDCLVWTHSIHRK